MPADGLVDALLDYILLYVVVDRATPTVVEVLAGAVGDDHDVGSSGRFPAVPSGSRALAYVVPLALGGLVAARPFDRTIPTAVSSIRVVAALDLDAVVPREFLVTVVSFPSFEAATYAVDGLASGDSYGRL